MPDLLIAILAEYSLLGEAWCSLLRDQPGISVAGYASQPDQLADLGLNQQFKAILLDWSAPDDNLIRAAQGAAPQAGLLVLVDLLEPQLVISVLLAGAIGVISRRANLSELRRSLLATSRGELVLPQEIAVQALLALTQAAASEFNEQEDGVTEALSEREEQVLDLLAVGITNKDIAQRLFLSVRTVEAHLRNIYTKLGVHNRTEAVIWAVRRG